MILSHCRWNELKPNYEKPVALPLGELAKGSGECNAGSGVIQGTPIGSAGSAECYTGDAPQSNCLSGRLVVGLCNIGIYGD